MKGGIQSDRNSTGEMNNHVETIDFPQENTVRRKSIFHSFHV